MARVQRDLPRRLRLQPVRRALPALASAPRRRHAPGAQGGREAVRRLPRAAGSRSTTSAAARWPSRPSCSWPSSGPRATSTPRPPGPRSSLHWVTAHVNAFEYLGGCSRHRGVRQPALGGDPAAPLRARRQRHLPGDGRPLRRGHHPGPQLQAPRQGQGRSPASCWPSAGSSPGCATSASPASARPTPRSPAWSSGSTPGPSRSSTARGRASSRSSTARRCGRFRPTRYEFATWRKAKVNIDYHVEVRPSATTTRSPTAWSARPSRSGCPPRPSRSSSVTAGWPRHVRSYSARLHHRPGAHARVAPPPRRVDTVAHRQLGRADRPGHGQAGRSDHGGPPASRAGLPQLPRHHPPGRPLRHRPPRGGLRRGRWPSGPSATSSVESILRTGLDRQPLARRRTRSRAHPSHDNVRGPDYYQ